MRAIPSGARSAILRSPVPDSVAYPVVCLLARSYKEGGPAAVANFEAGVQGFTTRAFRGCGVVTSEPFEVSDDMEAVQMLQRFTQVGEFYVMSKPQGLKVGDKGFMDIILYDEESDRHVKISYEQALLHTGLFAAVAADGTQTAADGAPAVDDPDPKYNLYEGVSYKKWCEDAKLLSGANQAGIDDSAGLLAIKDLDAPIVISRPFIEHAMLSAVLAVSGGDTGATIFGPSDMQISVRLNPNPAQDPCPACILEYNSRLEVLVEVLVASLEYLIHATSTIPVHIRLLPYLFLFVSCPFAGQHLCQDDRRVRRKEHRILFSLSFP